jgi:hypothetical protein
MSKTSTKAKDKKHSYADISSFEDACKFRGLDPAKCLPDLSMFPADHQQALLATAKMFIIAEALNQDPETKQCWKPDWNNWDEYKYTPWFDLEVDKDNTSGFRFDGSNYALVDTDSTGGSRLCYRSRDISNYAGQQFLSLYKEMMILPK